MTKPMVGSPMTKPGYNLPNGEYRYLDSMDNKDWYLQGRADQRRIDWPVGIAILIVLALYVVFMER